jgi:hypothetical protein
MRRMLASAVVLHTIVLHTVAALAVAALAALSSGPSPAHAGAAGPGPGVTGNDTGGIIQWTPAIAYSYKAIAVAHCARWRRYAGISSVRHVYGNYIGFQCVYDRRYDPRKGWLPPAY